MTFEELEAEAAPHVGTIVLMYHYIPVRLLGVVEEPDDYYYKCRPFDVNKEVGLYSAVGSYVPLKCYLPDDEYDTMDRVFKLQEGFNCEGDC